MAQAPCICHHELMMRCVIFRSNTKAETYLYLRDGKEFDELPVELQESFGQPVFVMSLDLSTDRKLARVDVANVLTSLEKQGFYLQLPPKLPVEEEITRRFS